MQPFAYCGAKIRIFWHLWCVRTVRGWATSDILRTRRRTIFRAILWESLLWTSFVQMSLWSEVAWFDQIV